MLSLGTAWFSEVLTLYCIEMFRPLNLWPHAYTTQCLGPQASRDTVILDALNPPWGEGYSGMSHGCSRDSGPKQKLSGYDPVLKPENPSPTSLGQRITTCLNPLGSSGSQPHPEHRKRKKRTPWSVVQVLLWRWDGDDLQKKFYKDYSTRINLSPHLLRACLVAQL